MSNACAPQKKMTCAELFKHIDCTIIGNPSEEISGLAYNSRAVNPGDAFFCIVGLKVDGHSFAQDAINAGAKVLIVERKVYLADATDVTEIVVSDSRKAMAEAAAVFYGKPSEEMELVGITGTNGKTTTTYLVEHILQVAKKTTGVIGTVAIRIGDETYASERTTPESSDLQQLFGQMRDAGVDAVAMEVSSHALDLKRVWASKFAVTAFTNLTQDHLDYHQTFEAYFEAKALLFSDEYPAKRVICIDDTWGQALAFRCQAAGDAVITTGFSETADIHPVEVTYASDHTDVSLIVRGAVYQFSYPLVGRFNVSNIMTAFGIALELGIGAQTIIAALKNTPGVPGRMQRVNADNDGGIAVFVDYAHTPDALEKAIASLRGISDKRLFVVFGCGGDRDATKRSIMGRAALAADFAIVTSDNPRTEDPHAIIDDILTGMEDKDRFVVEADRRAAIAKAISLAKPGDAILIAGKGHENYQIIGETKHDFDDRLVAQEELNRAFA